MIEMIHGDYEFICDYPDCDVSTVVVGGIATRETVEARLREDGWVTRGEGEQQAHLCPDHADAVDDDRVIARGIMTTNLYTYGYSGGGTIADLKRYAEAGLLIVDTRLKPVTRWRREFNYGPLTTELGDSYLSIPEFGNLNYQGGPIQINDFMDGMTRLRNALTKPRATGPFRGVVLLCTCANPMTCHRSEVAQRLIEVGLFEAVTHLRPGERAE